MMGGIYLDSLMEACLQKFRVFGGLVDGEKVLCWARGRSTSTPSSINQSLHLSSTMAGCVQGDRVFLSSKPLYSEPALPKMARSLGHPGPL